MAKQAQPVLFSSQTFAEVEGEAARLDRSLSWVITRAVKLTEAQLKLLPSGSASERLAPDDAVERELYFEDGCLAVLRGEANRLDTSVSDIVRRAWSIARAQIQTMPA